MTEKKRIRIESNGRAMVEGDTRVFIDGVDMSHQVSDVTWSVGVSREQNPSRATITFTDVELAVEYVAEEVGSSEQATVVPAEYFDQLVADLDAPDEPNDPTREAARRLSEALPGISLENAERNMREMIAGLSTTTDPREIDAQLAAALKDGEET